MDSIHVAVPVEKPLPTVQFVWSEWLVVSAGPKSRGREVGTSVLAHNV